MLISTTVIQAPIEKVWELLLEKVFHPNKFIPGIIEYEYKERDDNEYIRTIYTETDDVVELITIDEGNFQIDSALVKHAFLKGTLVQKLTSTETGTQLTLEQNREITLDQLKSLDMQPALDAAAEQIKSMVEEA